jgi:mannose-6-phosphate isomerase-like protein (cupin superfamily)
MGNSFTLTDTYLHLEHGQAERMVIDEAFWPRVVSGERPLPGWLVASFSFASTEDDGASDHSEMHPCGDEVHICLGGAMTAILEYAEHEERIEFDVGQTCIVPAGVWHRLVARKPSQIVSLTFGEDTEHRKAE